MKDDEVRTVSERPRRKPIILIGAPSGAGKTVLSQKMIEGKVPLTGIVDQDDLRFATRRDIKDISDGLTEERIYIIECATTTSTVFAEAFNGKCSTRKFTNGILSFTSAWR